MPEGLTAGQATALAAAEFESEYRQRIHEDAARLLAAIAEWEPAPCPPR